MSRHVDVPVDRRALVAIVFTAFLIVSAVLAFSPIHGSVAAGEMEFESDGAYFRYDGEIMWYMGQVSPTADVAVPDTVVYQGRTHTVEGLNLEYNTSSISSLRISAHIDSYSLPLLSAEPTRLASITVDPANDTLTVVDGVLYSSDMTQLICYPQNKQGGSFTVPGSVDVIGAGAFQYCDNLVSVDLSDVVNVEIRAFWGCTGLETITVPRSTIAIGEGAFSGCDSLRAIDVEPGNPSFSTIEGVLFDADATELLKYPNSKGDSYSVPDSVTTIGSDAFWTCTDIHHVQIPDSVKTIEERAFLASGLMEVDVPASVTSIGDRAFALNDLGQVVIRGNGVQLGSEVFYSDNALTDIWITGSLGSLQSDSFSMSHGGPSVCTVHIYQNIDLSAYSDGFTRFVYTSSSGAPEPEHPSEEPDDEPEVPVDPEEPDPDTPAPTPGTGEDHEQIDDVLLMNILFVPFLFILILVNLILFLRIRM